MVHQRPKLARRFGQLGSGIHLMFWPCDQQPALECISGAMQGVSHACYRTDRQRMLPAKPLLTDKDSDLPCFTAFPAAVLSLKICSMLTVQT